jgi:hypothetical protein
VTVQSMERTWSDDELAEAIRDHFRLGVIGVGHVAPRGAVHVTDHAVMGHVGAPSLFNRATALSMDQPDVALSEVDSFFDGLPHSLWIDADALTDDGDELLRGRGYVPLPPQHGMVCTDLHPADARTDRGDHAELVTDPRFASEIADAAATGFGIGVDDRLLLEDLSRAVLRHARPWDHGAIYVVRDATGRIASTASLLCTREVAGISGLVTRPSFRDRHAASAIVARALGDAAALGRTAAVMLATPDSESTLRRLGFRTLIDFQVYRQATR